MQINLSSWERLMSGAAQKTSDQGLPGLRVRGRPDAAAAEAVNTSAGPRGGDAVEWGMRILRERLEARFERVASSAGSAETAPTKGYEAPSAEQVAGNILGFVEARLKREKADGASDERLAELMAQARAGVEQGFKEAREVIEGLGRMNGDLSSAIDDSYARVQKGFARLDEQLLGKTPVQAPAEDAPVTPTKAAVPGVQVRGYQAVETASREQVSFEVVTREGDRVRIALDELRYAGSLTALEANQKGASLTQVAGSLEMGRYQLSVEGELSDSELGAIGSLLGEMDELAGRFFGGDVQGAFDQAMNMGINSDALASYSVQMSYTRTTSVARYTEVSGAAQRGPAERLQPLADVAKGVERTLGRASELGLAQQGYGDLLNRLLADQQMARDVQWPEPVSELASGFLARLLERLPFGAPGAEV